MSESISWPSAIVGTAVVASVTAISVTAINHYSTVDDALKFWGALSGLVGIITGAMVTYFFSRGTVTAAKNQADTATALATTATEQAQSASEAATTAQQAVAAALLRVDPAMKTELLQNPSVAAATGER